MRPGRFGQAGVVVGWSRSGCGRVGMFVVALAAAVTAACAQAPPAGVPAGSPMPTGIVGQPGVVATTPADPLATLVGASTTGASVTAPPTTAAPGTIIEVAYRLERHTADPATSSFEAVAQATLSDRRGWARAGFRLVRRPDANFTVVLAEGPEVDARCLPYDTYGQYSCQNGPTVALNADRWRAATPKWTGTLDDYRRYLVGHEVGHLLGLHHPDVQCPAVGRAAPLMAQQSTELNGCLPNPWPLDGEVEAGRRRPAELAPPYRPDPVRPG